MSRREYEQAESSFDSNENLEDELLRISQIMSERSEKREALILGKEAFAWNFRFIVRFIERYDVVASRMLFSLSARDEGIPEVVDIDDSSNISSITATWNIICDFPLRLDEKNKIFYNRMDSS